MRILAQLRLLPAMYGRDITVAMTQRYTGDVTVVPRLGGPGALLRIVQNPPRKICQLVRSRVGAIQDSAQPGALRLAVAGEVGLALGPIGAGCTLARPPPPRARRPQPGRRQPADGPAVDRFTVERWRPVGK